MSGTSSTGASIRQQAIGWAAATRDPDFAGWDDFTAWLEADPAHARAYDAVQFALEEADAVLAAQPAPEPAPEPEPEHEPVAANDNPPGWLAGRRAFAGGAVAAALALVITSVLWLSPGSGTVHTTAPGETRSIALGDGSTALLAGGSRLAVEGPRAARLEGGQALFTIRHDDARPFVLDAGGTRLVDAGTVFDVRLAGETLDVAVSEGAVVVAPQGQAIRLDAGMRAVRKGGRYRVGAVDPAGVGEWRRGRISFDDASLAEIAADLTRATGMTFTAAKGDTRLSGSIAVAAVRADPRVLEALLGADVEPQGDGWVIAGR